MWGWQFAILFSKTQFFHTNFISQYNNPLDSRPSAKKSKRGNNCQKMCFSVTHRFCSPASPTSTHFSSFSFLAPECATALLQSSFQDEWVGDFVVTILYTINHRRVWKKHGMTCALKCLGEWLNQLSTIYTAIMFSFMFTWCLAQEEQNIYNY